DSTSREAIGNESRFHFCLLPYRSVLWDPAGELRCLPKPTRHQLLVEPVALADVEVAHFLLLGLTGGQRTQGGAAEEGHSDELREAMVVEKPALSLDAIEGRVPLDGFAHAGGGAHDERVEAAPDVTLPARHRREVS